MLRIITILSIGLMSLSYKNAPEDMVATSFANIITKIKLEEMPYRKPNDSAWDVSFAGGPDVFFKILENGQEIYSTYDNPKEDIDFSELPLSWNVNLSISNNSSHYSIVFVDKDFSNHDIIGSLNFTARDLAGYTKTLAGGGIRAVLYVG